MAYVFAGVPTQMVARIAAKSQRKVVARAQRELWSPGSDVPAYLDGSLAGDFGYDPLGFSANVDDRKWMVHAELIHGRTAMVATAGILFTATLTKMGVANFPQWYEAGYEFQKNSFIPFGSLVAIQAVLAGFVEIKRCQELLVPGSCKLPASFVGFEKAFDGCGDEFGPYPGGIFDPMGMSQKSDAKFAELKQKEVKNGRLAMISFLGYVC